MRQRALDRIHELGGHHRRADGHAAQRAEVERPQIVAMLQKHREHGGDAARIGALVSGQRFEIGARLVGGHQHERAAGIEHRLHRAAQCVLVEERQRHESAIILGRRPVALIVGDIPEHAAMGHDRALGPTGRSRRVGLEGLRIVRNRRRLDRCGGLLHLRLEGEKARFLLVEQQPLPQRRAPRDRERVTVAGGIHDREHASRVLDDVGERIAGEPGVER